MKKLFILLFAGFTACGGEINIQNFYGSDAWAIQSDTNRYCIPPGVVLSLNAPAGEFLAFCSDTNRTVFLDVTEASSQVVCLYRDQDNQIAVGAFDKTTNFDAFKMGMAFAFTIGISGMILRFARMIGKTTPEL